MEETRTSRVHICKKCHVFQSECPTKNAWQEIIQKRHARQQASRSFFLNFVANNIFFEHEQSM